MTASTIATVKASTKRTPPPSGGKVGAPITQLPTVYVAPLMPVNPETVNTDVLESPRTAKETFVFADHENVLPDIVEGDLLVIGSVTYIIRTAPPWERPDTGSYLHLIVEEQIIT